ncbi:hypothetical protein [Actinomarinicola tropica]|uniref:Uncharacterized protein n=1 Tax=Actinomarinicola tropica TaxID=2789776 RepID=A0A5Q2RQS0_9ACTN|nr:hypothetical protein [Actinomarinicola tropica]QGG96487.1 hypothetical protein GH723_16020 [Actinomarinicola tropica]
MSPRRPRPGIWALVLLGVLLFCSLMLTIVVSMAIWPGEAKLTAPLFCDDARPDAYVVRDTYNVRPGETSMNFTLYCVGKRGDFDEVGWLRPTLALWAGHTVLLVLVAVVPLLIGRMRRGRRAIDEPPPTGSPFV